MEEKSSPNSRQTEKSSKERTAEAKSKRKRDQKNVKQRAMVKRWRGPSGGVGKLSTHRGGKNRGGYRHESKEKSNVQR